MTSACYASCRKKSIANEIASSSSRGIIVDYHSDRLQMMLHLVKVTTLLRVGRRETLCYQSWSKFHGNRAMFRLRVLKILQWISKESWRHLQALNYQVKLSSAVSALMTKRERRWWHCRTVGICFARTAWGRLLSFKLIKETLMDWFVRKGVAALS